MLPLADPPAEPPAEPPATELAMPGARIAPMSGAAIATATAAGMLGLTAAILSVLTLHSDGANLHAGIVALFYLPSGIVGVISARLQHRFVRERYAALQAEITRRADGQRRLADEIERRGTEIAALKRSQQLLLAEDDLLRERMQESFVNLSMRTLTLVERQLSLIERLERGEEDAKRLDDLFRLDHLATRMRRNSENVLVLANADERHGHRPPGTLLDVVRAAVSEIEFYERVDIGHIPRADLSGHAADDISHLISELLENAVEYSPPSTRVTVAARTLENRGILLTVEDEGFGVPPERLPELNAQLQGGRAAASTSDLAGLGVFVVGTLAVRHGVRVQLRPRRDGGLAAIVMLPAGLVHGTGPSPTEISHEKDRGRRESAVPATPARGTPTVGTPSHAEPVAGTPAQGTPTVDDSRLGAAAAAAKAEPAAVDRTLDASSGRA
ncbi:MAG: sensor histidine kinase, partial [Streptomycetaceae bacterium]|nr:sensor histidine kinase [Streptomycetaceae bacterium]